MLKSFSHIILSFLLLVATTGMAVSKHYCGDFLVSTSLFGEAEACCDSDNCCRNESSFFQLDEDFSTPGSSQIPQIIAFELFVFDVEPAQGLFKDKVEISIFTERKPPPPPKIQTLLSLKQVFLL